MATGNSNSIAKYFTSTFKRLENPDWFLPSWNETLFSVIFVSWVWYVNVSILQIISLAPTLLWNAVAAKLELVPHKSIGRCLFLRRRKLDWTLYLPHHGEIKCLEFVVTLQMAYTLSLKPRRLSFKADHFPIEATTPIFPQDLFERWLEVKQQLYSRNKKKRIGWKSHSSHEA